MKKIINYSCLTVLNAVLGYSPLFAQWTGPDPTTQAIYYNNSGNVGIGTTSPSTLLHVKNETGWAYSLIEGGAANSAAILELTNPTITWQIQTSTNDEFVIRDKTNNAKRLLIDTEGHIGIGTASPLSKFHVYKSGANISYSPYDAVIGIFEKSGNATVSIITDDASKSSLYFGRASHQQTGRIQVDHAAETIAIGINGNDKLMIDKDGKIGIGTASPEELLTIANGNIKVDNTYGLIFEKTGATNDNTKIWRRSGNSLAIQYVDHSLRFDALGDKPVLFKNSLDETTATIHPAGNSYVKGGFSVGTSTLPSGYILAVDGKAIIEEVQVEMSGTWPDYVFSENYELTPLSEIKSYVAKNHHLPDVPSADQVAQDGINLGEMNAVLLKKIEELTLHLIDIKEENLTIRKRLTTIESKNSN